MSEIFVHAFHIVIASGLLFYIGVMRDKLPSFMYPVILALGVLVFGYHAYKTMFKKDAWINYLHMFVLAPLLLWIGAKKKETPRKVFETILMLAFASFGYHAYYLYKALK